MKKWGGLVLALIAGAALVFKLGNSYKATSGREQSDSASADQIVQENDLQKESLRGKSKDPIEKPSGRKLLEPIQLITDNPNEAEVKLQEYADSLDEKDVSNLKDNVLNPALSGDERLISVELIVRSKTFNHDSILLEIANSPLVDHKNQTRNDEELAFRARAIEGIQSLPALVKIADRNSNKFLSDRAHRAMAHITGKAPSLKEQDEEALKKLVN